MQIKTINSHRWLYAADVPFVVVCKQIRRRLGSVNQCIDHEIEVKDIILCNDDNDALVCVGVLKDSNN